MLHRCLKILSLACLALILIVSGVLGWHFLAGQAQGQVYDLGGYFWSADYGWISLNSGNAELAGYASSPYKVSVDGSGNVSGWGWAPYVGWVCFGKTCDPNNICDSVPAGTPCHPNDYATTKKSSEMQAKIDSASHQITGWAKIISLNDSGWINLGPGVPTASNQAGAQCYDCQAHCDKMNFDDSDPPKPTTCQTYSDTNFDACSFCFTRTVFDQVKYPQPDDGTNNYIAGGNGNTCFKCSSCTKAMSAAGGASRTFCGSCDDCYLYGGASDPGNGASLGWAWNGNADEASTTGAGWIQLDPLFGESGLVYPWLQTQYGAVFGSNAFRQKAVVSGINATYCIFASDAVNFRSQTCSQNIPGVSLQFPQQDTADFSYKNALGRLDIYGLATTVNTSIKNGQKYDKYGNIIVTEEGNQIWNSPVVLNNKVYVINGDLIVSSGLQIANGASGQSGNGTVIVNGNLIIGNDFSYDTNNSLPEAQLSRLASVAWIVKGDIIVKSNVKSAVGAFIALGDGLHSCFHHDGTPCSSVTTGYPTFQQNGYGIFSSADLSDPNGTADLSQPLVISGLLMAKAFNFERTYSSITQGSEKIIYDGRLMANPPPGLKSLLEILPVIRDFQY